ncbi:AraC family transcriptional regulator [Clostridioides difficile]|uniref:helix-turn-helix transcriptional regulator n=1 Tax=Clostridioides difficile TaxID=1496 RepID=UPI001C1B733C|nr:helix-turn-helix transcriptional regulator [Clostridioides difficile]HBY2690849.1 helix-turn-helix transcriptional regulator [Clostridioides difficile]HCQ5684851.1 helix-turn-helix transcriptional regulator [Clostridioides difficile]HDO9121956.1 helix-turn-helix transcriptional regulator [Clostridioides difficile]HDO9646463.1 helix-turn-helix transcriptional regulator [Clostridioides difficile]
MSYKVINVITAIDYIEEHLSEKLDLDIVANAVHYSKYHLHRTFTFSVGLTMHDYIKRRKLTEAAKLLVFSKKPIIEIALIAGYESQQAFTSIFKAMYKKSPNKYRKEQEFYPLQLRFVLKRDRLFPQNVLELEKEIKLANMSDIPLWMNLVRLVIDGFPNLQEEEYIYQLEQYILEERALILKLNNVAIANMVFSRETRSIDFFGIHPQYRNSDIAQVFLKKVIEDFLIDTDISITTFREGDKADTGHRDMIKKLGFAEAELLVEFGYPTQKFILPCVEERDNRQN